MMNTPKMILFILLSLIVISCGKWEETERTEARGNDNVYFSGAFSEDSLCSVGYSGTVKYYDFEKDRWRTGTNFSACLFGLEALAPDTYIACGNNAGVVLTRDGGMTWQKLTDFGGTEPGQCRYASFSSAETGWIATPFRIGQTTDQGQSWQELNYEMALGGIVSVCNTGEGEGYVVTGSGTLLYTDDSGENWTEISRILDTKETPIRTDLSRSRQTLQLRMTGETGILVFVNETDEGYFLNIYKSKDGGESWTVEEVLPHKLSTVYVNPEGKVISTLNYDSTVSIFTRG